MQSTTQLLRVLAEPNRVRLLALLEREELTVAELAETTRLAQPRVSSHLARLKDAGLVCDRRAGTHAYYRLRDNDGHGLRRAFLSGLDDALLGTDREQLRLVLARRDGGTAWADAVAGAMERHYSPGRTWEATARASLQLIALGRVLDMASGDGVLAELLAPRAQRIDCIDISRRVVAAGRERLQAHDNVAFHQGDMHALPFGDESFDAVLAMQALAYSDRPHEVLGEAARVLRSGGSLVATALNRHQHINVRDEYGHGNLGFEAIELAALASGAGLEVSLCEITSEESRVPHFRVITLRADKP